MGDYRGLKVKFEADDVSLSKALSKARSEARKTATELRAIDKALKFDPTGTELVRAQQEGLQREIESTTQQLKLLRAAEEQIGKDGLSTQQWVQLQGDIAIAEQRLKGYRQALADSIIQQGTMNSALNRFGAGVESFGAKIGPAGRKIEAVGGTLTRTLTPAIAGVGAASAAAAVQIDTSLTNVKKTVDGTDEQYQRLKQSAIEFSETNAVSASQILDIQSLGAQLGFTIEELDEFGRVVSGLDIATNMDADTAATEMAQFANITKMGHDEISNYGSAIVGLGNSFATTESDISSMAMRIAAAGTQVGMSQADILGLATALASMGVEAEAGGTAISTIMAQIDKDIAMSGSVVEGTSNLTRKEAEKVTGALETWASTAGMTAQEFSAAWKADPVEALSALLENMGAATEAGGNMSVMLQELGIDSIRQTDVMKRLGGNAKFVAKAVYQSTEEWKKNAALQNEVDNRNASLAAQFEILKNKVVAMADQVGGPLAAALLDIVDQAEPLIQMIADGAKQFSEMSKSEQQAVLKAVALSAALGPMLSIFGKGVQRVEGFGKGLQKLAKFLATVDYKTSGASRGLKDYGDSAKKSESATKKQAAAVKASSVAMGAAKTAALGVAGILAGVLLSAIFSVANGIAEAKKRGDEIKATNGELSSSLDGLETGASSAAASLDSYGETAESVKGKADDLKQAHADLARSLTDTMTEAGASAGMLDSYMGVIEELGTKSDLTEGEQARLKDAVDRVNEACGTTFAVTDDVNGALYGQVDAIRAVVSAQQDRLRYEAASEGLKDLYKQQEADIMRISELKQQIADLDEKHAGQTAKQWGEDARIREEAISALTEAQSQLNATSGTVELYEKRIGELGAAIGSSTDEMAAFVSSSEAIAAALESTGQSADGFAEALAQCGVSTSALAELSDGELAALAQSYDGNVESIVGVLQEFGIVAKEEGAEAAEGFAEGISEGADEAVAAAAEVTGKTVDEIRGECGQFGIEGDEAVKAYAEAIASGSSQAQAAAIATGQAVTAGIQSETPNVAQSAVVMKDGILQAYDPVSGELSALTADAVQQIAAGITGGSGGPIAAMDALEDGVVYAYDPVTGRLSSITGAATAAVAGGITSGTPKTGAAAAGLKDAAVNGVAPLYSELPDAASKGSTGFAASLSDGNKTAGVNASAMAEQAALMNKHAKSYGEWGRHASTNFAAGLRAGIGAAASAASDIANAVKGILGHTVPKEGPLRNGGRGEVEWGEHSVQNFVQGVQKQMPNLQRTMEQVAAITASGYATRASSVSLASQRMAKPTSGGISVTVDQSGGMTEAQVYSAVRSAMSDALARQSGQPVVLKVGEREMARTVRKIL